MDAPPKRGALYLASSLVLIGACVYILSRAFAEAVLDPVSASYLPVVLLLAVLAGMRQYRAAFRYDFRAAHTVAIFLLIVSLFGIIGVVSEPFYLLSGGWSGDIESLAAYAGYSGCVGYGFLCSWLNARWARLLRESPWVAAREPSRTRFQFSLRELLGLTAVLAATFGLTTWFVQTLPPKSAEHLSREGAPFPLPNGATDVCYYRNGQRRFLYEFSVDEPTFLAWADAELRPLEAVRDGLLVKPINGSYRIDRYCLKTERDSNSWAATIKDGYYFEWGTPHRGVCFAYDRGKRRAYYHAYSSR